MSSAADTVALDPITQATFRKVTIRLVPILMLAFILAYMDRTNVGFAALAMNKDIGLSTQAFGWGAGILFFSYCGLEIPSNWLMTKVGARKWLARIMVTWGIVAAATALTAGPNSFYGLRLALGAAEAGFTPGAMVLLAAWFPHQYRTRILSWFQMSVPLASLVSGPLSVSVLKMNGIWDLTGWQWMFIVEGLPAAVVGIILLFMVTDRPSEAAWLNAEEKAAIERIMAAEPRVRPVHHFWTALADPRVLMLAGIQFGFTIGSYGVAVWLPLILKGHDLSTTAVGWLASLPYLCGCIATAIWGGLVDRTGQRIANLAMACVVGCVGLVISVLFGSLELSMLGMCIALMGITAARGIFWSIPPRFLMGMGAASGLAMINSIGTLGGFFGPVLMGWLKQTTGSFNAGLLTLSGLLVFSAVLTVLLRTMLGKE